MTIQLVTVPYRYDDHLEGPGRGPEALLEADLVRRLKSTGVTLSAPTEASFPEEERVSGPVAANIGRLGRHTADAVESALKTGDPALVLAGDDTAAVGVMSGVQRIFAGKRIGLVWLDAHADFNTPETSISGILAGMPVAIIAGLAGPIWRDAAGLISVLPTDQILMVGVRELDEKEQVLLQSTNLRVVTASDLRKGTGFENAVDRLLRSVDVVTINVDLDVLDPTLVPSASTPARNGLSIRQLARLIRYIHSSGKVATITVTSLNPAHGSRGQRSVETTLSVLEAALPDWTFTPKETDHAQS